MDWTSKKKKEFRKGTYARSLVDRQAGGQRDRQMDEKMERETGGHKETKTTSKTDRRKEGVKDTTNRQLEDQIDTHHFAAPS